MNFSMTISGKPVTGTSSFDVFDPATGDLVGRAPSCDEATLDEAMNSALAAFPGWAADPELRAKCLTEAAKAVLESASELGPLFTAEQGRPLEMAVGEIAYSASWLEYYSSLALPVEIAHDTPSMRAVVTRRPLGVVAAITPWNAPVLLGMWKIAAALAAGNTMVLKPSPATPLTTLALGTVLAKVLPPGVLNVVSGPDPLGRWMSEHPVPRKVSVTGSIATGRAVAVSAAQNLRRVTLELGGNDPAIVLEDADLDEIVPKIVMGAFVNSGQICEAIKRVYVPRSMYDEAVSSISAAVGALTVGDGREPGTQLGPLTTPEQRERVADLVEDAVSAGGRVVVGGHRIDGPGNFYAPTVVADVHDGTALVDDEQFGPALPIIAYDDVAEVVRRCNDSEYGLTASVWSPDIERAIEVADKLEVGRAKINSHGGLPVPSVPFGGIKSSGIGVENGPWGLAEYTAIRVTETYFETPAEGETTQRLDV